MNELSIENKIKFKTIELKKWESYEINWNKIITVVQWEIKDRVLWKLSIFESSTFHGWKMIAEKNSFLTVFDIENIDIILNKINIEEEFWEYCRKNWSQLRDLYDVDWFEKVDLYRWNQIEKEYNWNKYKFNLWFCWKEVDCLFHNQHDFIEIHTNIAWTWNMQKSIDWTNEWLIETVSLWIWASHRKFNIEWEFEKNGNPKYPFHRWLWWPTWNVWLVIEKY